MADAQKMFPDAIVTTFQILIFVSSYVVLVGIFTSIVLMLVVKSRRMRWTGHVAHMVEGRGVHRVLTGKPEG
jgi:hypothetical protein